MKVKVIEMTSYMEGWGNHPKVLTLTVDAFEPTQLTAAFIGKEYPHFDEEDVEGFADTILENMNVIDEDTIFVSVEDELEVMFVKIG